MKFILFSILLTFMSCSKRDNNNLARQKIESMRELILEQVPDNPIMAGRHIQNFQNLFHLKTHGDIILPGDRNIAIEGYPDVKRRFVELKSVGKIESLNYTNLKVTPNGPNQMNVTFDLTVESQDFSEYFSGDMELYEQAGDYKILSFKIESDR